jgi:hypothetical protein
VSKLFLSRRRPALMLATGLLAAALSLSSCEPAQKASAQKSDDPKAGYDIATVNYEELVALHPDYEKLEQIDKEIMLKEQEKGKLQQQAFQELQKEGSTRMQSAVADAKARLEAERASIEGEMASLSASLSAQMESELKGIQAGLQQDLERDIEDYKKNSGVAPDKAPDPIEPRNEGAIKDYMQNLAMVRERNLAARRLELEKSVSDEVNAKKAEVDGQVAAYEASLASQYQSERLNLQLTAQNSADEAAKTAAEQRLTAISQEIDDKKAAKRAELEQGYTALRAEKSAQLQSELEAYQNELNAEVAAKVEQKRRELGQAPSAPSQPSRSAGPPPAVQQKIAEMQARMTAELESRKAHLRDEMAGKAAEAKRRLQAKQDQVKKELAALEIQIAKEISEKADKLAPKTKAKIDKVDAEVKKLQDERKQAAEKIAADISREVGGVAQKKDVDMVVGVVPNYEYSSFTDLTELSKVAVQTENSK